MMRIMREPMLKTISVECPICGATLLSDGLGDFETPAANTVKFDCPMCKKPRVVPLGWIRKSFD